VFVGMPTSSLSTKLGVSPKPNTQNGSCRGK